MPDHGELLYEGKAKRIYAVANPDQVLVEFKNDATAFLASVSVFPAFQRHRR